MGLVARDAELAAVLDALGAGNAVVAGPAGVGKSALAAEAVRRARPDGSGTAVVRATRASAGLPYGALAHLLPPVPHVAPGALGWVEDAVAGLVAGRPPLLLVDDAHLLDPASAVAVHHLVLTARAQVLATLRTDEVAPDPVRALWKDELAARVELGPFDERGTTQVLTALLEGPVVPRTARRLHDLAAGNALLLRELVLAARASGALVGPPWRLLAPPPVTAPRLLEVVGERLDGLAPGMTVLLELLALGEPVRPDHVRALARSGSFGGATADELLEDAESRQLVRLAEDGVQLAHPLVGEVVRQRLGPLRVARRYRELAATAPTPTRPDEVLRVALWQLDSGGGDGGVLLAAARAAWTAHDDALAIRLAEASARAGGGADAALLLAAVHNHRLELDDAAAVLAPHAGRDDLSERQRAELALARAFTSAMRPGGLDAAVAILDGARAAVRTREWRQNLAALRLNLVSRTEQGPALLAAAEELLADEPITAPVRAQLLSSRAGAALGAGRPATAVASARRVLADVDSWRDAVPVLLLPAHLNWAWGAMLCGDLDEAERALSALDVPAIRGPAWEHRDSALALLRAQLLRLRGRLDDALAALDTGGELRPGAPFSASHHAERAHLLALRGDGGGATRALDEARAAPLVRFSAIEQAWIRLATPWVVAAADGPTAGGGAAVRLADACAERGLPLLEGMLLHDAVRLGGTGSAVADRLGRVAAVCEGAIVRLAAEHARAVAADDGPQLEVVAGAFARRGHLVHAADAAAHAADALRRAGLSRVARAAERRTEVLVERCQGVRTPALTGLRVPGLTRRQREMVQLAASGLTNREIAGRLVLSVRTVDNHLHAAYAKLGVTGRRDLAAALDGTPAQTSPPPANTGTRDRPGLVGAPHGTR